MRCIAWSGLWAVLVFQTTLAVADDWPQWLGPKRDSVWREPALVDAFPQAGLKVLWRAPVELGYSGPAVADGKVFVSDYVRRSGEIVNNAGLRAELQGQERLLCLDAASGKLLWKHEYDCSYKLSYPGGPRATPAVADGKVYSLGAMGNLDCLDIKTGKRIWGKELTKEYSVETPAWGFSGHPLVAADKLFCLVGGKGSVAVAFDKDTGKEIWRALPGPEPGYCAPTLIERGGKQQLVIWEPQAIHGLDLETGKVYWSEPLEPSYEMSIAVPRQQDEYLYASGVGNTAVLLKLSADGRAVEIVWAGDSRRGVYAVNSPPLIDGQTIYGVDNQGALRAVDLLTGKRLWDTYAATTGSRRAQYATAFLVRHETEGVKGRYFLFNEKGELILARLTPEAYEEIGRFQVLEPTNETSGRPVVWSHPAFANRCVYARNDKELVCVSLAAD